MARDEQQLQAAVARRDASIAESERRRELLRQSEADVAAQRAAVTEQEARTNASAAAQQPAQAEVQTAIGRARQALEAELQAARLQRAASLRAELADVERELGGGSQEAAGALPPGRTEHRDGNGRASYASIQAGVSQWERPSPAAPPSPVPDSPTIPWAHLTLGPQSGR